MDLLNQKMDAADYIGSDIQLHTIVCNNWTGNNFTAPTAGGTWTISKANDQSLRIIHPLSNAPVGWHGMSLTTLPNIQIVPSATTMMVIENVNSVVITNCRVGETFSISLMFI